MIVYIILLIVGLSLLGFTIFCFAKKKFFSRFFTPMLGLVSLIVIAGPTFSVIYHASNDQKAYETILRQKQELEDKYNQANEEEKPVIFNEIRSYNRSIEHCHDKANNPWLSAFTYSFYKQSIEHLVITL